MSMSSAQHLGKSTLIVVQNCNRCVLDWDSDAGVRLNRPPLQSIWKARQKGTDPIYCDKIDSDTRTNTMIGESPAILLWILWLYM